MQQDRITLQAPAKINLYLKVTGRRVDGYHTLKTLMQKVSLCDKLELRPRRQGIRLHCSGGAVPENSDNLVYRAAEFFLQAVGRLRKGSVPGVEISLEKNIPIAAGLGGGSSDAAATLKGLNVLYGYGCTDEELATMGLRLGADVPFFLVDTAAAIATGIGEIITPVPSLTGYSILLVNPGFSVSTRWVYQTFALTKRESASNLKNSQEGFNEHGVLSRSVSVEARSMAMRNDLEMITIAKYPEIDQLKNELIKNGAAIALMSGSGPTVFGLFDDKQSAEACRAIFKRRYEHTYLVSPFYGKE